jgi:hypothetical protein
MHSTVADTTHLLEKHLRHCLNKAEANAAIAPLIAERMPLLGAFFDGSDDIHVQTVRVVHAYISAVPPYFDVLSTLAEMDNISDYTVAFLADATQFFLGENQNNEQVTIVDLLRQAYLFHRMIEELNDRVALERQLPLAPIDLAYTNLVAHTIIGDDEANILDQNVLIKLELTNAKLANAAEFIFQNPATKALTEQRRDRGWQDVYDKWPFLTRDIVAN